MDFTMKLWGTGGHAQIKIKIKLKIKIHCHIFVKERMTFSTKGLWDYSSNGKTHMTHEWSNLQLCLTWYTFPVVMLCSVILSLFWIHYVIIWYNTGWPNKNGTVDTIDFLGLCSDQQLSFFTLLDRTSFPHYNNTKIIKFGWELFFMSNFLWTVIFGIWPISRVPRHD